MSSDEQNSKSTHMKYLDNTEITLKGDPEIDGLDWKHFVDIDKDQGRLIRRVRELAYERGLRHENGPYSYGNSTRYYDVEGKSPESTHTVKVIVDTNSRMKPIYRAHFVEVWKI